MNRLIPLAAASLVFASLAACSITKPQPSAACKAAAAYQASVADAAWENYQNGTYSSATMIHYTVLDQQALDSMAKAGCPGNMKVRGLPGG